LLTNVSESTPHGPRSKRATRQTLRARRDGLTADERAAASAAIARSVNAVLDQRLVPGDVVGLYAAKGSEVDTTAIAAHAAEGGLHVVYPRVVAGERTLVFHRVDASDLQPGLFGLHEPPPDAPRVELSAIAAFVIPGLAFDHAGGRTGWGMGHYDATLVHAPHALRIGIAFECQIVDAVPRDAHDIPMHYVITEVATHAVA
jgi:5-formyltetrahydrofolate cyclo-ligase